MGVDLTSHKGETAALLRHEVNQRILQGGGNGRGLWVKHEHHIIFAQLFAGLGQLGDENIPVLGILGIGAAKPARDLDPIITDREVT